MTYSKGHKLIAIEMNDLLGGKRPALYIGEGNSFVKVACFGNEAKAQKFEEWLRYFFAELLAEEDDGK